MARPAYPFARRRGRKAGRATTSVALSQVVVETRVLLADHVYGEWRLQVLYASRRHIS
jgi:hypothetical protein